MCSNSASLLAVCHGQGHSGCASVALVALVLLLLPRSWVSCGTLSWHGLAEKASHLVGMARGPERILGGPDHSNRSRSRHSSQRDYCEPTWCACVRGPR